MAEPVAVEVLVLDGHETARRSDGEVVDVDEWAAAFPRVRAVLIEGELAPDRRTRDGATVSGTLITYVNRASDLAYVLARRAAADIDEPLSRT